MVLVGALSAMLLSAVARLKKIEVEIENKERSLRINIQGVEDGMDRKLDLITEENRATMRELTGRLYR